MKEILLTTLLSFLILAPVAESAKNKGKNAPSGSSASTAPSTPEIKEEFILPQPDGPAAEVNGVVIPRSEIQSKMQELFKTDEGEGKISGLSNENKEKFFALIREALIKQQLMGKAAQDFLEKNPEAKKAFQTQVEEFKKQAAIQIFMQALYEKAVPRDPQALKTVYESKYSDEQQVELYLFICDTLDKANSAIKALKGGTSPEKLAKNYAPEELKKTGGVLGPLLLNSLPSNIQVVLKGLNIGACSKEPLKTANGYAVILLKSRGTASFDLMAPKIVEDLRKESLDKTINDLTEQNKKSIKRYDLEGKEVKEDQKPAISAPAAPTPPAG